ncbi:MAG: aminoacyl-tRNA hydrolase [Flavobacteriaceae bacterium]|nr:MAG: aminoacyl-tRNA hydrolase [Flavobacteriaceae bacterium]
MNTESILKELSFKATRSSGAGGQHVNKVSSKIVLFFDLDNSESLTVDEKELLQKNLKTKLTKENILILNCDESRSQHKNKEIVVERFLKIILVGLTIQKPRKATKIPRSVIRKRLDSKKKLGLKKVNRRKPDLE